MATKTQGVGGTKSSSNKPNTITNKPSNKETKDQKNADLTKKIKDLEDGNSKLIKENAMLKNNFDLKKILEALSPIGIRNLDTNEMAQDSIKIALEEADKKHSLEKFEMERKHKQDIEILKQRLQGNDQLPTESSPQESNDVKTDNYVKSLEGEKEQLTKEKSALLAEKHGKDAGMQKRQDEIKTLKGTEENNKKLNEQEKSALLAGKQGKDYEIQQLQTEIKTLKETTENNTKLNDQEKRALLAEKQGKDVEIQKLQAEIKALKTNEENNKKLNEQEKSALLAEKQGKDAEIQKLQAVIKTLKSTEENTKKLEEKDKSALLAETQGKDAEIQTLQAEIKALKTTEENNKKLNEQEKSGLLAEKQGKDAEIQKLKAAIKALKTTEENNKKLNEQLTKLAEERDNLKQEVTALRRSKESKSPPHTKFVSADDNKAVQQLKVENERLRTRLSEVAGAQMTHNNPSIADLSDAFRPTKLSEEYNQLYDNLWTDAFEEHGGKKEEDIIQMLRNILLGSYTFCVKVCGEFTDQLTNSSLALPNSKPKNVDIPIVCKKQLQDMKKSFGALLRNDVKESYRKQNTIEGGEKTKSYMDACVELLWLMVIQEPPVVIETPASKDSAFDSDTYRTYTKTGTKVDFVVWPALRLHQGGPLLTKGVAQGKN